jgi:hypothetical protein
MFLQCEVAHVYRPSRGEGNLQLLNEKVKTSFKTVPKRSHGDERVLSNYSF